MVNVETFLLICACAFSVLSALASARAIHIARQVPDMPKRLAEGLSACSAAVCDLDERFTKHVKRDAGDAGVRAKAAARAGDNGVARVNSYEDLDRLIHERSLISRKGNSNA